MWCKIAQQRSAQSASEAPKRALLCMLCARWASIRQPPAICGLECCILRALRYRLGVQYHTKQTARGEAAQPILASSSARCVAAYTAFMKAARMPAFSSSCTPAMVVPAGGDAGRSLREVA